MVGTFVAMDGELASWQILLVSQHPNKQSLVAGCNIAKRSSKNCSHKPIDNIISDPIKRLPLYLKTDKTSRNLSKISLSKPVKGIKNVALDLSKTKNCPRLSVKAP